MLLNEEAVVAWCDFRKNENRNRTLSLEAAPAFSVFNPLKEALTPLFSSVSSNFHLNSPAFASSNSTLRFSLAKNGTGVLVSESKNANNSPLTGVVFSR
ncbi:hypothetical protein ACOSP7_032311 [Xanthoceras sorbifolium]